MRASTCKWLSSSGPALHVRGRPLRGRRGSTASDHLRHLRHLRIECGVRSTVGGGSDVGQHPIEGRAIDHAAGLDHRVDLSGRADVGRRVRRRAAADRRACRPRWCRATPSCRAVAPTRACRPAAPAWATGPRRPGGQFRMHRGPQRQVAVEGVGAGDDGDAGTMHRADERDAGARRSTRLRARSASVAADAWVCRRCSQRIAHRLGHQRQASRRRASRPSPWAAGRWTRPASARP